MKAIYLKKYGKSANVFEIRETETPQIKENEVLINVQYFGLNFADVVARNGLYPEAPKNPAVLGYDVSGTVESVGKNVSHVKIGDKVCALTRFGGYAEKAVAPSAGVVKLPDNYEMALSTALATQACTAYFCSVHSVSLTTGDKVLIQAAAGGVGSILVQIAKHHGCEVFGTASTSKLDHLKSIGVDHAIDYRNKDFYNEIKSGNHQLDFVFDSIGGKSFKKAWKLLKPGGTMVYFGAAAQIGNSNIFKTLGVALGFGFFSPIALLMQSKSMVAVNMLKIADHKPDLFQKIFQGVIDYSEKGIIKPTLSKIFPAEQIGEAHDFLESRKSVGKIVMEW